MEEEIRRGLTATPKTLPAALLYDDLGSALFEAITRLPEYPLARADLRLLARAGEWLDALAGSLDVIELGPGGGKKARVLLEALTARQGPTRFYAVDISAAALAECRRTLDQVAGVGLTLVEAGYLEGLTRACAESRGPRLVLFLGSNLSNFDREAAAGFLAGVRGALDPGDALLLATDLDKPVEQLRPAYDDALGVTAAFNKNLLVRLNREHGGDFDVAAFAHEVRWNAIERRIEMHLRSLRRQQVALSALRLTVRFEEGETVWTESSYRFDLEELRGLAARTGFRCVRQTVDREWAFAHSLLVAGGP